MTPRPSFAAKLSVALVDDAAHGSFEGGTLGGTLPTERSADLARAAIRARAGATPRVPQDNGANTLATVADSRIRRTAATRRSPTRRRFSGLSSPIELGHPDHFADGIPHALLARLRRESSGVWVDEPAAGGFDGGPGLWIELATPTSRTTPGTRRISPRGGHQLIVSAPAPEPPGRVRSRPR
jgi:hypothetical protein